MSGIQDGYEQAYADKLWALLPDVYRAQDTEQFGANGPLRELVNRIGAQAANVRRNIDRLWEDQSIETCDDWVIPYIGDLLATNLVPGLGARGQRLDVANTISYRRRKGTVAVLEQIATNITGCDAKVVEFFRRLGRTRHGLDPALGQPLLQGDAVAQLQQAEGLVGAVTRTGIGGFADLRNVYGASNARTAFDEYFYTADLRAGDGTTGWYNIPSLGVFLWRLQSFLAGPVTPVAVHGCPDWYTFDPTGRDVPLFAAQRSTDTLGDGWVSPQPVQLATPISQALLDANAAAYDPATANALLLLTQPLQLYPNPEVMILQDAATGQDAAATATLPATAVLLRPARGRFRVEASPPPGPVVAKYCYGFASQIGAGPYDRRVTGATIPAPAPVTQVPAGADALTTPGVIPGAGTLTIGGSLTCDGAAAVQVTGALTLQAAIQACPLIRLPPDSSWEIHGTPGATLVLDGLFVSGGDVVLTGSFDSVTLNCCTFDPGTEAAPGEAASPPGSFALSADLRPLRPTRLWIEATITTLNAARCILGAIRTRAAGRVITPLPLSATTHPAAVGRVITPLPLSATTHPAAVGTVATLSLSETIVQGLADGDDGTALHFSDGAASLSRCTVLGPTVLHRVDVSESILRDLATVDDTQDGCVRFSAWASGSTLPRKYESVSIPAGAGLFTSTDFGQPGYAQLLASADASILPTRLAPGASAPTIIAGAADGSEMGCFAREKTPQKLRGLLLKFQEYMPAGLVPVPIAVT
jgi:hypothetical protein